MVVKFVVLNMKVSVLLGVGLVFSVFLFSCHSFQRSSTGKERLLGLDHPETLDTIDLTARLTQKMGLYVEAKGLYEKALKGKVREVQKGEKVVVVEE